MLNELPQLDWMRMPLSGRVLIEASAGTGKTFNIGLIYLRLLIERDDVGVDKILVTTFTDAAAQELRERLRARLIEAERWFEHGAAREDDPLDAYLAQRSADAGTRKSTLRKIQRARAEFDRAPIGTIHGLCQRIQRDFPLRSGAGLKLGAPTDESALLRECLEDFWRRRYLDGEVDAREAAQVLPYGPEGLLRDLKELLTRDAQAIAADGRLRIDELIAGLRQADAVAELRRIAGDKQLYAPRKTKLSKRLIAVAETLASPEVDEVALDAQLDGAFDPDEIDGQSATAALREHALIRTLQELRGLFASNGIFVRGAVLAAALAFCRDEMPQRARAREAQTFAMLIDAVHERLCGDDRALADELCAAFPAALIDEFQDTDTRQFEIFDRIYRDANGAERGLLVMIGDPKQAIFGFRGGDIAAYLRASAHTRRYSLAVNHRSSTALVGALNALYAHADGGFDDPRIRYREVGAAGSADARPYAGNGVPIAAPLVIHRFRGDHDGNALGELETLALADCANRIAELLNDPTRTLGGERVQPGDIAVLLATNKQVAALRKLLAARRVPCVGSGRGSVFDTDVARDFELILHAVINADDDRAVRGALTTRLLGATYADIAAWQDNAADFDRELDRFAAWRDMAQMRGVLALVAALIEHRAAHWLAQPDGERTITDLRHLGELLAAEEGGRHGLDGIYAWLATQRRAEHGLDANEAHQPRIETDAQRVKLLTVHAAKGLQFPIVFLPLPWRIARRDGQFKPKILRYHDGLGRECVDLGSAQFPAHRGMHFREDLQERLRLLYVAMTRAQYALHVYWADRGIARGADDEAWKVAGIDMLIHAAQQALDAERGEAALDVLAARLPGVGVVEKCTSAHVEYRAAQLPPRPRELPALPALRPFQWLHSFSSLVRNASAQETATRAADETQLAAEESETTEGDARLLALGTLRGPRFGDAVHAILEDAAANPLWPEQQALVSRKLGEQALRFDGAVVETVARWLDRVRTSNLGDDLRLIDLAPAHRVVEFEFQLPLHAVPLARLRALCEAHGCAGAVPANLAMAELDGMLSGYIDLVFAHGGRYHVLDYKTNWLGTRLDDYSGAALEIAMRDHHYDLQALLYTVALHRYLRSRLDGYAPERHLGDCWYLFLRAVGLRAGTGVWRRRWPDALIRALDDAFAGVEAIA